jgi:hypothetical protein
VTRWRVTLVAVSLGLFLSSGCSSSDPPVVVGSDVSNQPGTETDYEGARADVSDEQCSDVGGRWRSEGTVTNSADGRRSYRIYVAFLGPDGDTLAIRQANVDSIRPEASRRWVAELDQPESVGPPRCVLRVERFSLGAD